MHSERLSYAQIQHDLLATTRNSISPDISVQSLDLGALAASAVTEATEDLTCLPGAELECDGGLGLQACNGAAEFEHGFDLVHLLALVDHVFKPCVGCFDLSQHVGKLESDHRVINKLLAESASLVGVFHRLLVADARKADTLDDYANTLVAKTSQYYPC